MTDLTPQQQRAYDMFDHMSGAIWIVPEVTDQQLNAAHFRLHKYIAGPAPKPQESRWISERMGYSYDPEKARRLWKQDNLVKREGFDQRWDAIPVESEYLRARHDDLKL